MRRAPLIALCFVFLSAAVPAQDRSANRLLRVQAARLVRVCIWPDYYSITYRNPKTQTLSGIDNEMAQALGKDLGVGVEFVPASTATGLVAGAVAVGRDRAGHCLLHPVAAACRRLGQRPEGGGLAGLQF
ncbi:MAG: transporter substrate-binding domain-containing protein [Rhodoferax sp.]